jgi:hypothetical protein
MIFIDMIKNSFGKIDFRAADVVQYQEIIKNKNWVFWGDDNMFPNHLLALFQNSPIHRACTNAITYGVQGKKLYNKLNNSELIMANRRETLYEVYKKCVIDKVIFGVYSLNIVLNNAGGVSEIYHTDVSKIRSGKVDEFNNVQSYYLSAEWRYPNKFIPIEIPSFDLTNTDVKSQLYFVKNYTPNYNYYSVPDYFAAVSTIQLDIEVKSFHLNNIQNSLLPSMAISFNNGIPSDEEKDILYNQLLDKYSSTNNAGKIFLFFSDTPESAPTITPIPNNGSDDFYTSLYANIEETILTSHRITSPMILGIKTAGQLGGRAELEEAYNLFQNIVIKPQQNDILEHFNKLLFLRDKQRYELEIEQSQILDLPPALI